MQLYPFYLPKNTKILSFCLFSILRRSKKINKTHRITRTNTRTKSNNKENEKKKEHVFSSTHCVYLYLCTLHVNNTTTQPKAHSHKQSLFKFKQDR